MLRRLRSANLAVVNRSHHGPLTYECLQISFEPLLRLVPISSSVFTDCGADLQGWMLVGAQSPSRELRLNEEARG
jgi:hypothetical protein